MKDKFGYRLRVGDSVVYFLRSCDEDDDDIKYHLAVGIITGVTGRMRLDRATVKYTGTTIVMYVTLEALTIYFAKIGTPECSMALLTS